MNGKQAKRLRREAQAMTVGMPDREYHVESMTKRKVVNKFGDAIGETGTVVLGNCTRKAYKLLKRNHKRKVSR